MNNHKIQISDLNREKYALILCYPKTFKVCKVELERRIEELKKSNIEALEFMGDGRISNISVLGKGCVGIVITAYRNGEKIVIKIRRMDANRPDMTREGKMLKEANMLSVGPKFLGLTKNFLLMQHIDGELISKWLNKITKKDITVLKKVLREILEQCWRLDTGNLDHGELSNALKHIIIDGRNNPFILDFETASVNRRMANVTSICHFLFLGGGFSRKVNELLSVNNKGKFASNNEIL